jgi:very-short-patch-repair endonuclease
MVSIDSFAPSGRGVFLFGDQKVDEVYSEGITRHLKRELDCLPRGRRFSSRRFHSIGKGVCTGFLYGCDRCESPAEKILLAAAAWSVGLKGWQIPFIWPSWSAAVPTYPDVVIVPQHGIGRYRVDFAIYAREMRLVVEVDGHEWHEKTKEQAARDKRRDRDLQQEGWAVFHFTGSEVWNDPFGCCETINKYIQRGMTQSTSN